MAAGTGSAIHQRKQHPRQPCNNGIQVTNHGSPPFVPPLDVVVQGNTFSKNVNDGMQLNAQAGSHDWWDHRRSQIPLPPQPRAAITRANTFDNNLEAMGWILLANGGTLNFMTPPAAILPAGRSHARCAPLFGVPDNAFGIYNNAFTANTLDGLHIQTTGNSVSQFHDPEQQLWRRGFDDQLAIFNMELVSWPTARNDDDQLIGGTTTTNADGTTNTFGNTFNLNGINAINLAVTGTASLSYNINNNTITNTVSATVPAPHDEFTFTFNGTSGTDPFVDHEPFRSRHQYHEVSWNLAGTPATFATNALFVLGGRLPGRPSRFNRSTIPTSQQV